MQVMHVGRRFITHSESKRSLRTSIVYALAINLTLSTNIPQKHVFTMISFFPDKSFPASFEHQVRRLAHPAFS